MPRFFVPTPAPDKNTIIITGGDANHIIKSLRQKPGDKLTLCDGAGYDYHCVITKTDPKCSGGVQVETTILEKIKNETEPKLKLTLFQALPKAGKLETIIQKATELGVCEIVPFIPARAVSRPDNDTRIIKYDRHNKIAREAAMQSGRGIIPAIRKICGFNDILE